ncbi:slr1306 family protein [Microcoleus sp. Pol1C5]|uniref:slr1306 family protein n=2 Tax=Microcoleus TaxID=44471 RepID=UPI002FD216CD
MIVAGAANPDRKKSDRPPASLDATEVRWNRGREAKPGKVKLGDNTHRKGKMTLNLRRPILIGGIGLSAALWLLETLQHSGSEMGETALIGLAAAGAGYWWWKQQSPKLELALPQPLANREAAEKAIAASETAIKLLASEAPNSADPANLTAKLDRLRAELDRQDLRITVTGGKAVGKTALIQVLNSNWASQHPQKLSLQETAALFANTNADAKIGGDLVLFVTAGDITDSEFQTLSQLAAAGQRVLLVWNKQDQYLPEQQSQVLHSLQQKMQGILGTEEIIAIAASPNSIKVRRHQADGTVQERIENQVSQLDALTERLTKILTEERQQLVWASAVRDAASIKLEAKTLLNAVRRDRALPIIEQYQYIAAATVFANPVPALDLLATTAISTQLVIDLGDIYQRKFSLDQAKTVAATLANQMFKLGLVELSTQTITGLLKSNAVTYVAGGAVQGISAAYFTRIAGLSLIEYFQSQELENAPKGIFNLDQLTKTLQAVFTQNQQVSFLQSFVNQVASRLSSQVSGPETVKSAAN